MKTSTKLLKLLAASALAVITFTGCESTDNGGNVGGSVYMGVGYYDTWYYGHDDCPPDVIVTPPEDRPRPEHPIANPPPSSTPRPTPMPSIPSTPRPMPRAGGRR